MYALHYGVQQSIPCKYVPYHFHFRSDIPGTKAAEILIAAGADVNAVNGDGQTPLLDYNILCEYYENWLISVRTIFSISKWIRLQQGKKTSWGYWSKMELTLIIVVGDLHHCIVLPGPVIDTKHLFIIHHQF